MDLKKSKNVENVMKAPKYKLVVPFPPYIYELYLGYLNKKVEMNDSEPFELEKRMFFANENLLNEDLYSIYRIHCLKVIKFTALELLKNTYSPEKADRITNRTMEFMNPIFPIMQNKSLENQIYVEGVSELLFTLLESGRLLLLKSFTRHILDIFEKDDFFRCSKQTLKYWSKIVDWVVSSDKTDWFAEYLNKVTMGGTFNLFFSKDAENKQRIKLFERICFIIYSGDRDKYEKKLVDLIEKISEVIKNAESQHPALLIMIFNPNKNSDDSKETGKNPNLILAALKLIELISIVGIDEFYLHQWIFLFDYFGLRIHAEQKNVISDDVKLKKNYMTPFEFQPYITNHLPIDYKIDYSNTLPPEEEKIVQFKKRKRQIIMTNSSVESEIEIKNKALWLCQYLIANNEYRSSVDPNQIENLIEGDFISLDDYIFKIN